MTKKGFSLIEVLIASMIFTVVMITATAIFVSSSRVQAKTQMSRDLVQQTRFAMETMVRDIRLAKKYTAGPALYQLTLTTTDDKTITYSVDNNEIIVTRDGTTKRLTDAKRVVVRTSDVVFTGTIDPKVQPSVHIALTAASAQTDTTRPETQGSYKLETTVSLRNFVKSY